MKGPDVLNRPTGAAGLAVVVLLISACSDASTANLQPTATIIDPSITPAAVASTATSLSIKESPKYPTPVNPALIPGIRQTVQALRDIQYQNSEPETCEPNVMQPINIVWEDDLNLVKSTELPGELVYNAPAYATIAEAEVDYNEGIQGSPVFRAVKPGEEVRIGKLPSVSINGIEGVYHNAVVISQGCLPQTHELIAIGYSNPRTPGMDQDTLNAQGAKVISDTLNVPFTRAVRVLADQILNSALSTETPTIQP
jgi:hypothetical protein